jgi:hypothetical protein
VVQYSERADNGLFYAIVSQDTRNKQNTYKEHSAVGGQSHDIDNLLGSRLKASNATLFDMIREVVFVRFFNGSVMQTYNRGV